MEINLAKVRLVRPEVTCTTNEKRNRVLDDNGETIDDINEEEEIPVARSGHRIIVTEDALYSIGGYNPSYWDVPNEDDNTIYPLFNELWKFNITTRTWHLMTTVGNTPREMASHTALVIGNKLFVHGGTGTPFGDASSNQLHVCDLHTLTWKHIQTQGDEPEELYGHSLTAVRSNMLYTFGGTTGYEYRNTLHMFNLRTCTWTEHENDRSLYAPEGRYRHEAVADDKFLYILGGGSSRHDYGFEKIDVYNLNKGTWEQLSCFAEGNSYPLPRRCHAAVKYKRSAYIIGGYNRSAIFQDIWRLNFDTLEWSKIQDLIHPVYFHSADVNSHGCVYIYGGVNKIDDERNSDIYTFCLEPPPLQEQCWTVVYNLIKTIPDKNHRDLHRLGIPLSFLNRL